jgi:hypothetical protein
MWDTREEHTDVISYLTANTLLLDYAENLLMPHMRTAAVCSESNTKDTNRRLLCSCVVQVALHSVAGVCACVRACARSTSEYFAVYHERTVRCDSKANSRAVRPLHLIGVFFAVCESLMQEI